MPIARFTRLISMVILAAGVTVGVAAVWSGNMTGIFIAGLTAMALLASVLVRWVGRR